MIQRLIQGFSDSFCILGFQDILLLEVTLSLDIYPESVHMTYHGMNLLYLSTICSGGERSDKVQVLHELDDSFISTKVVNTIRGRHTEALLPLHSACMKWRNYNGSVYLNFDLVKILFDYYQL